jgi:hypothetical protein
MDPNEQAHVLGLFTHGTQDTSLVPSAYNSWLTTTRGTLPPLRLPSDLQKPGGSPANGQPSFGVTGYSVQNGKVSPEIKPMLPQLTPEQMAIAQKGVADVFGSDLFNSFTYPKGVEAAKEFQTTESQKRTTALEMNSRLMSSPAMADFNKLDRAYGGLKQALVGEKATGADALAGIYTFVSLLDPGSMVREGETYMVRKTGGVWDDLQGLVRQVSGKSSLDPTVQKNILNVAGRLAGSAVGTVNRMRDDARELAKANGIEPDRVSPKAFALTGASLTQPAPTEPTAPTPTQAPGFLGVWRDDGLPIFQTEAQLRASGQPVGYIKDGAKLRKVNAAAGIPVPGAPGSVTLPTVSVGEPVAPPASLPSGIPLQPDKGSLSPIYIPPNLSPFFQ